MKVTEAITKLHEAVDVYARLLEGKADPISGIDPNEMELRWHVADFVLALDSQDFCDVIGNEEFAYGVEEAVAMLAAAMVDTRQEARE